ASCAVTLWAQRTGGALVGLEEVPLRERAAGALLAYVRYAGKAVWPARLSVHYPHDPLAGNAAAVAGGAPVPLSGTAAPRARRAPFVTVGWLWFPGMLVPVIGLVQVGDQGMADRYMYLPLAGLCFALAWSVRAAVRPRPRLKPLAATATGAAVIACAFATR